MAPRIPVTKKQSKAAAKKSNDRVIKRPARGYHTFKNGMLNVKPKGAEKDVVKSNQASSLLSLPPELRNRIWRLVLGNKYIRETRSWDPKRRPKSSPRERINTFALLRACRQIYAETALLPLTLNTLTVTSLGSIGRLLKGIPNYQRKRIKVLHIETWASMWGPRLNLRIKERFEKAYLKTHCPALQRIHVYIYPQKGDWASPIADAEAYVKSEVAPGFVARGYEVTVEVMTIDYAKFETIWCYY